MDAQRQDGRARRRPALEDGKPIEADKTYKVAGWAPVSEEARAANTKPVWEVVEASAEAAGRPRRAARHVNTPKLLGVQGNAGLAT